MRLVLDTNIVVSAAIGSSAPARLIELAADGEIELATSAALLAELAGVLARQHIAKRLSRRHRSGGEVVSLYSEIADHTAPASITPTAPDPDDDEVLACAVAAGADLIVSGDRHLLNLKTFHGIPILLATEALAAIARHSRGT